MDKDCLKEHPARCGDPQCFPAWRKDCALWHVRVQASQQQQQQRRQQQRWQPRCSQAQGNGVGADPGRAGPTKPQGPKRRGRPRGDPPQRQVRRQQQQRQRQLHQPQRESPWWQRQQDWHQQGQQQERRLPSLLSLPPLWQQQQQQRQAPTPQPWLGMGPSYRDVVVGGATGQLSPAQDQLLARLAALESRLAGLCQS